MSRRLGVCGPLLAIALAGGACSDSSPAAPVAPPEDAGAPPDASAPDATEPVDAAPPDLPLGKNPYGAAYPTLHLGWRVRESTTPGDVIPNLTFIGLLPGATAPSRVQMADVYDPEGRTHDLVVVCLINLDSLADMLLEPIAAARPSRVAVIVAVGHRKDLRTPAAEADLQPTREKLPFGLSVIDPSFQSFLPNLQFAGLPGLVYLDARTMEIVQTDAGASNNVARITAVRDAVKARPPAY
jgi:hypothetical protein